MAARYPYTSPSVSSSYFSFATANRPTILLGVLAIALFIYILFFDSAFSSFNESGFRGGKDSSASRSDSDSSSPSPSSSKDKDSEMSDYLANEKLKAIMKELEAREKPGGKSDKTPQKQDGSNNSKKIPPKKDKIIRVEFNDDEDVRSPSDSSSGGKQRADKKPAAKSIPDWVSKYDVSHLFDWTWKKNGDYKRYQDRMVSESRRSSFSAESPSTVNDVRDYLLHHAQDGILVDDFEQLKNPVPHPLPRTAQSTNFQSLCERMNLNSAWLACKMDATKLSTSQPYSTRFINAAIFHGFVDSGSCHPSVPGTVFTNSKTYHFQQWTGNSCYNSPITHLHSSSVTEYDEIADSVGTYTNAIGHFPNQQLPRLIRMAATVPNTTKLLVATGGVADGFLDVLVNRGVLQRDRIVPWNSHHTYYGKTVFRSESWPYLSGEKYNHYLHDRTDMELMHKVFVDDVSPEQRNKLVVIQRKGGREISNHNKLVKLLEKYVDEDEKNPLEIVIFKAEGSLQDHINLFKKARLVVGPHGAGLINLMWCAGGTHAIEVGYNSGMTLPSMYFEVATHSNLQYWLIYGNGDYGGHIAADENELDDVFKTAVQEIQDQRKEEGII